MKKYIYLILLSFVIITCKAQSPVYDIGTSNFPPTLPKNSYFKDLKGDLDGYDGTYMFTDGTTTLKIALKKKVLSYGYYYKDLVVGELQFIKNGLEMINTIPNINYDYTNEEINHVIKGNFILTGTKWGCADCSPTEKRLRLSFVDNVSETVADLDIRKTTVNGAPAINVHIFSSGDVRMVRPGDPPQLPATIPLGKYLMTRVFDNVSISRDFNKNDCEPGGQGSWLNYYVEAGKHTSTLSQADADQKALDDLNTNGQANANAKGWCTFKNKAYTNVPFKKNNCVSPYVGTYVPYSLDAGWVTSSVSQADADEKAKQPGQANANFKGTCIYGNYEKSRSFIKNNCVPGGFGTTKLYTVPAGTYSSTISQADADAKADAEITANGQNNANTLGTCYFRSKALTNIPLKKVCIAPKVSTTYNFSAGVGYYISYVSQADADAKTLEIGQILANTKCTCY